MDYSVDFSHFKATTVTDPRIQILLFWYHFECKLHAAMLYSIEYNLWALLQPPFYTVDFNHIIMGRMGNVLMTQHREDKKVRVDIILLNWGNSLVTHCCMRNHQPSFYQTAQ